MTEYYSIEKALEYGIKFAEKKGAEEVEGFSSSSREINLSVEKKLPKLTAGISTGVSFRVVSKGNLGFGFTKTLTKERLESTISTALSNAKSKGKDPDFKSLPLPSKKKVAKVPYDKKLEKITSDMVAEDQTILKDTINDVKHLNFLQSQLFLGLSEDRLVNSNGIDISSKSAGYGGLAAAITTKGLIPNYVFEIQGGNSVESFNINDLAKEAIYEIQRAAAPKTMNFEKEVPIILEPEASTGIMGGLFVLLVNQLSGDNVASGATPYSDQVGNLISVEDFTLIDNGINPDKLSSSTYDGEGMPREKTVLVDKGILKTFLLDTYYGSKLGLESNGKSTRTGMLGFGDPIKTAPSIGNTTMEILGGDSTKEEMIAETREGFMVHSLMGLHMSDRSSGRFSVTGFGWYIKNGEVKYPVQGISISGMLPELIKNIDMISKEPKSMLLGNCPYMRFSSVPTTAKKFDLKTRFGLTMLKIITLLTGKHPMF
ncbi:MAG: TldD/PmbA family protein [Asgard group archaeon]|nr:TldD/PmbA family protein [Asgard group archaeon]